MDISQPFRTLAPTLDGVVLRVLARVDGALTTQQVIDLCQSGSPAGIRKVLRRLSEQGVVIEERIGRNYTFRANREHLVWPAVDLLLNAARRLDEKIAEHVGRWQTPPVSVELFGSVADGTATAESDVDVMIVRPHLEPDQEDAWNDDVAGLREAVERWTGNPCETLERDLPEVVEMKASGEPVLASSRVTIAGEPIDMMFPTQELARKVSEAMNQSRVQVDEISKRISEVFAAASGTQEFQARIAEQLAATVHATRAVQTGRKS